MFRPKKRTLRATVVRAVCVPTFWIALFASIYLVMTTMAGVSFATINVTAVPPEQGAGAKSVANDPAPGSQADVIERAGCETAPEGVFPSSVIADPAGSKSWTHMESDKALGHAFEQLVFDGILPANEWTLPVDHGMRVGVFCK
jgi:hypothetical protein